MKNSFVGKPIERTSGWRIRVAFYVYLCSSAFFGVMKKKLTALSAALGVLFLRGGTTSWSPANWLEILAYVVVVYAAVMLTLNSQKKWSQDFLMAHGLCAKDGYCPRPF